LFMPISDLQNPSGLTLLDTKALAVDRLLVEPVKPPAVKEDFSKIFARVHKPREPERQEPAAQDPAPQSRERSENAHLRQARTVDDPPTGSGKEGAEAPKQTVSAAARMQLLRLLRALQLSEGTNALAGTDGKVLKSSQLSDTVSIITAGPAPGEAEILSYAKELGLSPDAIKTLMAELQADGLFGENQADASLVQGDVTAGLPMGVAGLTTPLMSEHKGVDGGHLAEGSDATQLLGVQTAALDDATSRWLSLRGQVAGSSELTNSASLGQASAGLKADGSGLEQSLSDRATKDGQPSAESSARSSDALSKIEKLLGPGALKEMLMGKAAERAMANESMMKTALLKDVGVAGPLGFESIDLSEFASELSNPFDRLALSSGPSASGAFGLQASMGDSSGRGLGGDTSGRQDGTGGTARAFSAQLSQRFGDILGQRLLQQISQGNWKVELNLEPGDLGSIRVEMEFKKGELEASFRAGQAMTKDLLQDSLPRLREALERSGITIASMNVGGDRQERSRESLSQQNSQASARRQLDARQGEDVELEKVVTRPSHDGSLDVLV
jgi:flagellar hook-length control protein FliK